MENRTVTGTVTEQWLAGELFVLKKTVNLAVETHASQTPLFD